MFIINLFQPKEDSEEPFPFNLDEFVTVDEVIDVEDTQSKATKTLSKTSSRTASKTKSLTKSAPLRTRTSEIETSKVAVEVKLIDSVPLSNVKVHQAAFDDTVKEDRKECMTEISEATYVMNKAFTDDLLLKNDDTSHVGFSMLAFKDQPQTTEVGESKPKTFKSSMAVSENKNTKHSLQDFADLGLEELLSCHTGENSEALLTLDEVGGEEDDAETEDEQLKNALSGLVTLDEIVADEDEEGVSFISEVIIKH